jgi:hypothetical protein
VGRARAPAEVLANDFGPNGPVVVTLPAGILVKILLALLGHRRCPSHRRQQRDPEATHGIHGSNVYLIINELPEKRKTSLLRMFCL